MSQSAARGGPDGSATERIGTVVIGGGQAGLAMGYHLVRAGLPFVILEAHDRVGDSWRRRWDSLHLFTPARNDALPGSSFPAPPWSFPSRDEFADYLEGYAGEHALPVRTGVRVERLSRAGEAFLVETDAGSIEADEVVIASGFDRLPRVPDLAVELDPAIVQLHSAEYRGPHQLPAGTVLVVGAGNSGADIALELAGEHEVLLSGRHPGQIPWRIGRTVTRPLDLLAFFAFSHVLTIATPPGRRMRPQALAHSGPLIRVKKGDLAAAGVERVPRTAAVTDGMPVLEDGRRLEVAGVVWCTGYRPDNSWIDLPVIDNEGRLVHERGVCAGTPGLYTVGQLFQYSLSSSMIHGVGRDAAYLAARIAERAASRAHGSDGVGSGDRHPTRSETVEPWATIVPAPGSVP
jgi:putative flavoprotein involved in K+ transport